LNAEFWAVGLHSDEPFHGGNLEVRGFSTELCRLILDLARAGPFALTNDGDSSAVILVSEEQRADLPADMADYPKLMVCRTAEELESAREGGFDRWQEFRDAACGGFPPAGSAELGAAPERGGMS